jgi:predicted ATPase
MIRDLSKLLIEASARTQVIITTHSTQLIEEFSERPEAVIVCEKENGESNLERLDAQALSAWLKEYNLGQLWANGQLGGNRW